MTHPYLTLEGIAFVLPDGRRLFGPLDESLDHRHTGLVGRNGVGKSVLARLLTGELQPSSGRCVRRGRVFHLPQHITRPPGLTVAGLAGVQAAVDALARIESGSTEAADYDTLADRWDIRERLQHLLERNHLPRLHHDTPAEHLSGGEAMRVALIGATLREADVLILDEPTNHLDRPGRLALTEQLHRWPKGLLVISHDRRLLDGMARILELSPKGLRSYGGGYDCYAEQKAAEQASAQAHLAHCKLERRREQHAQREQRERLAQREARGQQQGREANQARILLDRQKERSQQSAGRLKRQHQLASEDVDQQVREAARQLDAAPPVVLLAPAQSQNAATPATRMVVELEGVALPFAPPATQRIDLTLRGRSRVGVIGPNGCGKSTLLKLLDGRIAPLAGRCAVHVPVAYLDQELDILPPRQSILEHLRHTHPALAEHALRTRLALLGLGPDVVTQPSGRLSGGERLKGALACVLHADPAPQLLLLDEPNNHLDLAALHALETMLQAYAGALVVVSHDDRFLEALKLTDQLHATPDGWRLEPVA